MSRALTEMAPLILVLAVSSANAAIGACVSAGRADFLEDPALRFAVVGSAPTYPWRTTAGSKITLHPRLRPSSFAQ